MCSSNSCRSPRKVETSAGSGSGCFAPWASVTLAAIERISQQEVAEISGTSLYTVSRTLASWEERRLVETGRQHFRIRDPEGLARISEGAVGDLS